MLVEEHSPDHRCRHGFDFEFDAAAPHPLLDEFFAEVFSDVGEQEARDRTSLIQEFVGAALLGLAPSYRRCLVLVGPRGTAKSQVAEMIQALFPAFAVSSVAPHRWHERFSLSGLVGRALNVVPELPASELLGTDAFKAVVTGDIVGAEHKFRPSFSFKPRAAHLFITNELPATHDFSEAFFGRFLLCRMDRDMLGASSHRIDAARAIIDAERGAMAAWAVNGAARLVRARGYTIPSTSKETTEQWRRDVDNVAVFVDEECRPVLSKGDTAPDGTLAKPLYGAYRGWAYANEYRPISSRKFAYRMRALGLGAVHTNAGSTYPVVLRCAPQTFDRRYSN
ncbi:MAG TPA: phage/plasmid primase, P4 family [Polyangiaceae bacterium]|nr:phage/plasmid primase, P4 family [Polyangiaceae bacterium]